MSQKKKQKQYWQNVIAEIERGARKKTNKEKIKEYDFYSLLPKKLHERVSKIIPLEYSEDVNDEIIPKQESVASSEKHFVVKKEELNESTCSLVERKEKEFPHFDLNLEFTIEKKTAQKKNRNWYSDYVCENRKNRIKWKSKTHKPDEGITLADKPLDVQAEELMEASAERFAEWYNDLGSKSEKPLTIDHLKSLFSIEGNPKLLASIQTDPKEVNAIAQTVADKWNLPEMAIELKYEDYINAKLSHAPQASNKVAFGKTIPFKDLPWVRTGEDVTIETIFPEELLSGENLFKGIAHLRSTKALIEYCKKKPHVPKPKYLVDHGYFKEKSESVSEEDVPLYKLLKIKF